jgi:hypothetical protein
VRVTGIPRGRPWVRAELTTAFRRSHERTRWAQAHSAANSWNAAYARGAQTVPGPPFIEIAMPSVSATSGAVTPCRACAATLPSHCRLIAIEGVVGV